MAYQQTNATSVENLIDKIAAFAVAQGWTQERNSLVSGNRTVTLKKSGDYVHLWNTTNAMVRMRGSVGYDSLVAPNLQPNVSVSEARCQVGTGPFSNVFMFGADSPTEHIFVVVEVASGIFRHLCFGELTKLGAYTGGTFFDGFSWFDGAGGNISWDSSSPFHHRMFDNGQGDNDNTSSGGLLYGGLQQGGVRCDVDGNSNYFAPFGRPSRYTTPVASGGMAAVSGQPAGGGDSGSRTFGFYNRSVNTWTGITPLQPVLIRVERAAGYFSDIGTVPNIRYMNMARFAPGDEFTIGGDTWKVFPWIRKGSGSVSGSGDQYSDNHAFAYRKIT